MKVNSTKSHFTSASWLQSSEFEELWSIDAFRAPQCSIPYACVDAARQTVWATSVDAAQQTVWATKCKTKSRLRGWPAAAAGCRPPALQTHCPSSPHPAQGSQSPALLVPLTHSSGYRQELPSVTVTVTAVTVDSSADSEALVDAFMACHGGLQLGSLWKA